MNVKNNNISLTLRLFRLANGENISSLSERISSETNLSVMTVYNILAERSGKTSHKKTFVELEKWLEKNRVEIKEAVNEPLGARK